MSTGMIGDNQVRKGYSLRVICLCVKLVRVQLISDKYIQTRVTWGEGILLEVLTPPDWPANTFVDMSGYFLR